MKLEKEARQVVNRALKRIGLEDLQVKINVTKFWDEDTAMIMITNKDERRALMAYDAIKRALDEHGGISYVLMVGYGEASHA